MLMCPYAADKSQPGLCIPGKSICRRRPLGVSIPGLYYEGKAGMRLHDWAVGEPMSMTRLVALIGESLVHTLISPGTAWTHFNRRWFRRLGNTAPTVA